MDRVTKQIKKVDATILSLDQIHTLLSNVVYFQACEIVLLTGRQKATYLYTLMFYNVVSYCSNYVIDMINKKDWLPYVTITETSQLKHLGMTATKMTLEWTKFLIFLLTAVFILLTIGFAQEVQDVHTSISYITATAVFYLTTDPLFIDFFTRWGLLYKIEKFECREQIYGKLGLKLAGLVLAIFVHLAVLIKTGRYKLALFGVYANVYLKIRDILASEVKTLVDEESLIQRFRVADKKDIHDFDDVCAICLGEMRTARGTRCRHLFHDHCLSMAVKTSPLCPTCKADL